MNEQEIRGRMDEIVAEMTGLGEVLFGFLTVNRNKRARKRKPGMYVSPPHHTFNYRDEEGRRRWKRVPAACLERVRELVGRGKEWERLAEEYQGLANRLGWGAAASQKKTSRGPG